MAKAAFGYKIPYDFCAVQDKNLIEDGLWKSAQQMNEYDAKLEQVWAAQLLTPEFILGSNSNEYLVVKSTFNTFLSELEERYEARRQQFEAWNDDLVVSASTRVAREVFLAIEAYREREIIDQRGFENMASELFVMENEQPHVPADNDNIPF